MPTLNQSLNSTSHRSILMRKARKLGLSSVSDMMELAAQRGCHHYVNLAKSGSEITADHEAITNDELVILLLHGNNQYEPNAVRCAAQLLKSALVNAAKVTQLAIRERVVKQLRYIAEIGFSHDSEGREFWQLILEKLKTKKESDIPECVLPHRSRFMLDPGMQRGKKLQPFWLNPSERQ